MLFFAAPAPSSWAKLAAASLNAEWVAGEAPIAPRKRRISLIDWRTVVEFGTPTSSRASDDGARSFEDSVEIAIAAARDGTTVRPPSHTCANDFPTTAATMERLVCELNEDSAREGNRGCRSSAARRSRFKSLQTIGKRRAAPLRSRRKSPLPADRISLFRLATLTGVRDREPEAERNSRRY